MTRPTLALSLSLILSLTTGVRAAETPISFKVRNELRAHEKPTITLTVGKAMKSAALLATRVEDNRVFRYDLGKLARATPNTVEIGDGTEGRFHWRVVITAESDTGEMFHNDLTFESAVIGTGKSVGVKYERSRIHLDERWLEILPSGPIASVAVKVTDDDGDVVGVGAETFAQSVATANRWTRVNWQMNEARGTNVFQLELRVTDPRGATTTVRLIPWSVQIPHEEVNFATAKWDIAASEEPKLTHAIETMRATLDKVMRIDATVDVRLYVVGHTDTVGDAADNRVLSRKRAVAIANYFQAHGITVATLVAGCGEDALKISTGDNQDEPRNRRVDYILAAAGTEPALRGGAKWQSLH